MECEPQAEHQWLQKLVGNWRYEVQTAQCGDHPPTKMEGTESVRSIGGLWTIGEGSWQIPDGSPNLTVMTLGYDQASKRFFGSFVGSMMTHQWIYSGSLNAEQNILTLDTEGPAFGGSGMANYQDIIEFITDDHRTLTARTQNADGTWNTFMTSHYYRTK